MHIEEHVWHSNHLGREMTLKVYGHWGIPFVVFPCSRGRYFDYEGMGMVGAIASFIDNGQIKLFCVDSVDAESWYNYSVPPDQRNARHEQYDRYIVDEIVPFVRNQCHQADIRPMTNGYSMGAYHAVNFFSSTRTYLRGPLRAVAFTAWIAASLDWGRRICPPSTLTRH